MGLSVFDEPRLGPEPIARLKFGFVYRPETIIFALEGVKIE